MPDQPALGLVIQSGRVDRVHYALLFATGAAAVGRPVTLFFTMAGCRALAGLDALLPAEDGTAPGAYDDALTAKGIAGFAELWESLEALGARFQACDSGLVASGMSVPQGVTVTGVVGFLADVGSDAQLLWV
ncbi:MAG: DsrE family protein [Alphaproteobacteria bacterium]|nr:DsrE family protein [Alphaproteobacteria bacterium]MCB9931630.1 DsrE family protein [Alphaproteobacteria bacterium]